MDENGRLDDFLAAGFAPEELRRLQDWPGGPRLFEHLRDLDAPLRLADFGAWSGSLGLPPGPIPGKTLQVTPVRCRGQYLGAFFLSDKEGGEQFTDADEEILVLLASQAATAIANARTCRADLRDRADGVPEPGEPRAAHTFLSGGGRHTLEIDLPPDLPRVMADAQVLNNLVSNAARHSPQTTPIRIDAARDGFHVA